MTAAFSDSPSQVDAKAYVEAVTRNSGTSFYGAMRLLPRQKREAMYAVYAYCREIDDIADDDKPLSTKIEALKGWRAEIDRLYEGHPTTPTGKALYVPIQKFNLQKSDFLALIEGMEIDAQEYVIMPDLPALEHYCDCVAGAVGMLSIRIFGSSSRKAEDLARNLGRALQLTNILRDLTEDKQRNRLYLPQDMIMAAGIQKSDPLSDSRIQPICTKLAKISQDYFTAAQQALKALDRRQMRPAVVMMHVYHSYLNRLLVRGWSELDKPVHVPKLKKLWIALRYGLF
ncbi:MAG: presqualene diphosphate synthase HpnD [Alphaproteobacteria bacterium]